MSCWGTGATLQALTKLELIFYECSKLTSIEELRKGVAKLKALSSLKL